MNRTVIMLCFCILCLPFQTRAEEPVSVKIYRTQLNEISAKVKAMAETVERQGRTKTNERVRIDASKELLALQKLNYALLYDASAANLRGMRAGKDSNKDLLLIAQASSVLGVVLEALINHSDTQDKAFLGIDKDSERLFESINRLL